MLSSANHGPPHLPSSTHQSDKWARTDHLWQQLLSDPSLWWDNRLTKKSSGQPDFKHKTTLEVLWIDSWLNPPWVKEKLSTMAFNQMQSRGITKSRVPAAFGDYEKVQKLTYESRLKEALPLLESMVQQSSKAAKNAFVVFLRACTRRKALAEGKQVHALIVKAKCDKNIFLSNLLIGMYSDCGCIAEALEVFAAMPQRNVFSWTAMISAYVKNGQCKEAVALYQQMHQSGLEPDEVVCVVALKACTNIAALEQGQQLHSLILKRGFHSNVIVQNALVDMYAKCGCLKNAHEVFVNMTERDVISWNAMIAGYAKCGRLNDAHALFNSMPERDVVSWNALITGYAQNGFGKEALDLYEQMKREGIEPDNITLLLLLKACASISALQQGKELHSIVLSKGLELETTIQNTLVDMYAKCGCLKDARELFDKMTERNVVSWTVMISGYAQKGLGKEALHLFKHMRHEGLQANALTYVGVLSACRHCGLVNEGRHIFESMSRDQGVTPTLEHYGCMVDLLGRAGCLSEAEDLILKMPIQPNKVVWMSLLGAARKYVNGEIGRRAFEYIVELEPENDAAYLLLMDICSAAGKMDEVANLSKEMKEKGLKKGVLLDGSASTCSRLLKSPI